MHTGHIIIQCLNMQGKKAKQRHIALEKALINQLMHQYEIIIT